MNLLNKIKQAKDEFLMAVSSPTDVGEINFEENKKRMFIIISEDMTVIESCIKAITDKVALSKTSADDVTVIITSYRMIKEMDNQSNNEFSKILFGTARTIIDH